MDFFDWYPRTDFHELNLDWFLRTFKKLLIEWSQMKISFNNLEEAFKLLKEYVENYFDNLDVQEEINNKLDEMYESGELESLFDEYINKLALSDRLYTSMVAQILPEVSLNTDYGAEGFCVAVKNNTNYVINTFIKGANESDTSIVIYNYDSGAFVNRVTGLPLGHANSVTYNPINDHIYVACAGGASTKNYVVELNWNLQIVETHNFSDGDLPYGITFDGELFYVMVSGNRIKIFDSDFNYLRFVNFNSTVSLTYQGIESDDNYLYLPVGNAYSSYNGSNIILQAIDVYYKTGTFKKRILVDCIFEVEEIGLTNNGEVLIGCNTGSESVIFKSSIYNNINTYESVNNYYFYNDKIATRFNDIYVDRTYHGFYMDGSETYPISNIFWLEPLMFNGAEVTRINIKSDLDQNINIKESTNKLNIMGNGHKIAGIYVGNSKRVSIYNVVINDKNTTENAMLSIMNTKYVYVDGISFEDVTTDYCIHNVSSFLTLLNCEFNITANLYLLSVTEGGYINAANITDNVTGKYLINNANSKFASTAVTDNLLGSGVENADNVKLLRRLSRSTQINLNNLKRACIIEFTTGVQPTNGPTVSNGEWILSCEMDCTKTTYATQKCLVFGSGRVQKEYTRFYSGSTFTDWYLTTTFA